MPDVHDESGDARRKQRRSQLWFTIHSIVGVKLYLLLAIILISGTLAVFAREIDWLLLPEMRVTPVGERASPGVLLAALREAHPRAGLLEGFFQTNAEHPRTAARAIGVTFEHGVRAYWIDPYDVRVTGHTSILTAGYVLAQFHAGLFVPVIGNALVSLFALFIVTSLLTGLVVYKRWWRGFLRRPRTRNTRLLAGDLHRLLGVWSLIFLIAIGATSLFFLWDFLGVQLLGFPERPHLEHSEDLTPERLAQLGPAPVSLPLDDLIGNVARSHPTRTVSGIALPEHAAAPFEVFLSGPEALTDGFASRVDVDPFNGEILATSLASDQTLWQRVNEAVTPLHFGHFLGLAGRMLWFLFGVATSTLALSGLFIHVRRLTHRDARRGTERRTRLPRPWGGPMGALRPLVVLVLVVGAYGFAVFASFVGSIDERAHIALAEQGSAPWQASAMAVAEPGPLGTPAPLEPGSRSLLLVRLCDGCERTLRALHASVVAPGAPCGRGEQVEGERDYLHARVAIPPGGAERICLTLEGWDGSMRELSWNLDGSPRGT